MPTAELSSLSVTTRFGKRLSAVWLTYRTRPLAWLMLLIYLVAGGAAVYQLHDPRPPFEIWEAGAINQKDKSDFRLQRIDWGRQRRLAVTPRVPNPEPKLRFATPDVQKAFNQGKKPVPPEKARTIEIYSEEDIPADFWEPGRYPRVETVIVWGSPLTGATLRKLIQTHPLKALSIRIAHTTTADDLRSLADADHLELLQLDAIRVMLEPGALSWPKNLRTLSVTAYAPLPIERIQEWRALPRLESLILNVPSTEQASLLAPEIVAELEQFPQRPTLYLDVPEGSDGQWAVAAQSHFRRLAVRPGHVLKSRTAAACYAFGLVLIPLGFSVLQLTGQGLQPWSQFAPGAAQPHQWLAALLWASAGTISTGFASYHGVAWPTALAIPMSGVLSYTACGWLLRHDRSVGLVGLVHPVMAYAPLYFLSFVFVGGLGLFGFYPTWGGELDWFLRGRYPALAFAIILIGIWTGRRLLFTLFSVRRIAEEAGTATAPLSMFDFVGWARITQPFAAKQLKGQANWNPLQRNREWRIEATLNAGPALTRAQRVSVWLCGLPMHPFDYSSFFVAILIGQSVVFFGVRQFSFEFELPRPALTGAFIQILMMFLFVPMGLIWSRRRWMAHEMLFPISRRDWMLDGFVAQMWLYTPIPFVLATLALTDAILGGVVSPAPMEVATSLVGLVYAIIASWAVSLLVVTWSPQRLMWTIAALVGLPFVCVPLFLLIGWLVGNENTTAFDAFLTAPATITVAVIVALTALMGLIAWARRSWQTLEVGRVN